MKWGDDVRVGTGEDLWGRNFYDWPWYHKIWGAIPWFILRGLVVLLQKINRNIR